MKQMIEIDVPEGYEFAEAQRIGDRHSLIHFKKKEPEFIEVRDYLSKCHDGTLIKMTLNSYEFDIAKGIESQSTFIRWIDNEPRKVEI